ncbi:MAG: prepilin peptidase [Pseudomonadales bacterium]
MFEQLQTLHDLFPRYAYAFYLIFGLLVGSFLNVVIYRLPKMLERDWQIDAAQVLGTASETDRVDTPFNLAQPRSQCPGCGTQVKAIDNIPIVSFVLLRGRCGQCQNPISLQYPAIELTTGLVTLFLIHHFGLSSVAVLACLLTYALIALSTIDYRTTLLPDSITLPFLWLGLLVNINGTFTDLTSAVVGAMAGYLSLWSVYWGFKLLTGKDGMGFGDFKLLGLLGAWLGWQMLPIIIILSSLAGAIIGLSLIALGRDKDHPIPFGPYLAIAGWTALIWGESLTAHYFELLGGS